MPIAPDSPHTFNALGQPVGLPVVGWTPPPRPSAVLLEGRYCRLERLDAARHAPALHAANAADAEGRSWSYMTFGPFADAAAHERWLRDAAAKTDPWFYAVVDETSGAASGIASYMRITPDAGAIEVGSIHLSPCLARTRAATEAMYLMMAHAFELGYRRYEWKCDALNAPSRRAAERLGFSYEGTFRQAMIYKGRNRDTAWYALTDGDWPRIRAALESWLAPANFSAGGVQHTRLNVHASTP
jgi:RimJ/RimL family protein N-acetyltransferase